MSNVGCYIDDQCMNHLMYADDICLLAPTASAMLQILDICNDYCVANDIKFNSLKQGWQPAFTAGIIRRLKPDKTGPDNTPKSGFYRLLLAFTIFLLFSSTKTVLTFYMFIKYVNKTL